MKLKKKLLTLLKNNVTLFAIIVFGFILFKSYANNENQSIGKFSVIPSATIKAEKNEICAREFMAITFEGSGGTAPYVFTYKINDSSEQTITSNNLGIADIRCILVILLYPGITFNELIIKLGITKQSLNRVLKILLYEKMVIQEVNKKDKRIRYFRFKNDYQNDIYQNIFI